MLRQFVLTPNQLLPEDWYPELAPAQITIHSLKTGRQIQEPSLIAAARSQPDKLAAAGGQALSYQNDPDMVVFSPFRQGQIAHYPAAQALIKALLKQAGQGAVSIPKPVMCVHIQERTTQVEEQALAEAAIQCGARKVFFYSGTLSQMVQAAESRRELRHAILLHIDP